MELAAKIAMLVACAFNFGVQSLYFTHMLQLNSYRNERYRKWCRDNETKLVSVRRILPVLLIPAMYLPVVWGYGAAAAILLLTGLLNLPKKAKKPLVFTNRVRRLLATQALLLAALLTLAFFSAYLRAIGFTALFSLIIWAWTWLANTINHPLEKHIADGYVKDARARLQAMPNLIVVGITGSYGKTSAKNFLHDLLAVEYNVLMTPESYNTTMGVVRTIRERLRPSHQVFIAEMGAKTPAISGKSATWFIPGTASSPPSGSSIWKPSRPLTTSLPPSSSWPTPSRRTAACFSIPTTITSAPIPSAFPTSPTAPRRMPDYRASDIVVDAGAAPSPSPPPTGRASASPPSCWAGTISQNLTGCIALAHRLGIPLSKLVYPIRMLRPVEHRLQLLPNGFIDDAYNSNPAGFRSALDVLAGFDAQRVLVTPGMVELGERQEALNRELGEYAAARCDYAVLVGEKQAPPLKEGLLRGGFPEERIYVAATLQDGLAHLNALPAAPRIVLLENDLPDNF